MALSRDEFFDPDFGFDFGELSSDIDEVAKRLFPDEDLSPDELAEFSALSQRAQRLSPIRFDPVGSTAIPGNPYSYDVSPIVNGIQSGLQDVINAARQRRSMAPSERGQQMLGGAEQMREYAARLPEGREKQEVLETADAVERGAQATSLQARLAALAQKAERGQQAREQRGELIQELFPDIAGRLVQGYKEENVVRARGEEQRRAIADKYDFEAGLLSTRGEQRLVELDRRLQNELRLIEEQNRLGINGRGAQFTKASDVRLTIDNMADNLREEITRINGDFNLSIPEQRRRTQIIEERIDGLYNNTLTTILGSLGYTPEQAEAFARGERPGEPAGGDNGEGEGEGGNTSANWNDIIGDQ